MKGVSRQREEKPMKKVRIFVVCCFVVALAAFPALASAAGTPTTPTFKAVAKLSHPTGGNGVPAARFSGRNVSGGGVDVFVRFFVPGFFVGFNAGGLSPPPPRGSFMGVPPPPVPTGNTFSFDATISTATDGSPV